MILSLFGFVFYFLWRYLYLFGFVNRKMHNSKTIIICLVMPQKKMSSLVNGSNRMVVSSAIHMKKIVKLDTNF